MVVSSPAALVPALRGTLAFPVTPYSADGSVDLSSAEENASWLATSGVSALVSPSGAGEIWSLTEAECRDLTAATVRGADGRVPVVAGVGFGARVAVDLARSAEDAGADSVMVMPPYFPRSGQVGLREYYAAVAAAVSIGVVIYARDGVQPESSTLISLVEEFPNLIGYKDGTGDLRTFQSLRAAINDFAGVDRLVWLCGSGDDLLAPYVAAGAEGYTSSIACFWPEAALRHWKLAGSADPVGTASFFADVIAPFFDLRSGGLGIEVSLTKVAMELLGFPVGEVRPPLAMPSMESRERLADYLQRHRVPTRTARR